MHEMTAEMAAKLFLAQEEALDHAAAKIYRLLTQDAGLPPAECLVVCLRAAAKFLSQHNKNEWREIIQHASELLPPCCMGRRCTRTEPYPCCGLCGADVLRAPEVQHAVQNIGGDGYLGRLSPLGLRAQPAANNAFPARDIGLHQSTPVVSRRPLPAHAAALGDTSQMPVALRRRGLRGFARHRIRARWHDHGRSGMAGSDLGVDIVAVIGVAA